MSRYVLASEAQDDLVAIRDYLIEEDGPRAARSVIAKLVKEFRKLCATPGKRHVREDLNSDDQV